MYHINLNTKKVHLGLLILFIFLVNLATVAVFVYKFENQKTPIFDDGNAVFDTENKLRTSDPSSIFFDDFENGLDKWQNITGLWHMTDNESSWPDPYHSPTHSMWFGNESTGNYATGAREMGDLISEPFSLINIYQAELEFYQWRMGEGMGYDVSYVYISTNGTNWDQIYYDERPFVAPWERVVLNISKYCGYVSIQVRFFFDTLDSFLNNYRGWLVDDVRVLVYHDLNVSLEVPVNPQIYNTYSINATVFNTGWADETNVNLHLYLNGGLFGSQSISNLPMGANQTINFMWTPTEYGHYNFTAFVLPVPDEEYIDNNMESQKRVIFNSISGPVAIFRNVLPWGRNATEPILDMYSINYTVYDSSYIGIVDLSPFEKVIIESDQDQTFYNTLGLNISWFESYATNGGILEIHAADGGYNGGTWEGLYLMPGGINQTQIALNNITINLPLHPILSYPHIITDTELDNWFFSAHGYFNTYPGISKEILLDGNTLAPVFLELDYGQGTILITMQTLEYGYDNGYSNLLENLILFDPDALMITTPSSASSWDINTSQSIYWTSTGTISDVKLELYKEDVFVMEIISSTPNDGEFYWDIPATLEESVQYQIKIIEFSDPSTLDYSDYFEIFIPSITITTPNSTSLWETGSSQSIYWTSHGTISDVKLELYKEDVFFMEIISSTPNNGEFSWLIPSTLEVSDQYQIKIIDVSNPSTSDYSDYFEIVRPSRGSRGIPGYTLYILIGLICLGSLILTRKFNKSLNN